MGYNCAKCTNISIDKILKGGWFIMVVTINDDFDLNKIYESGQCFRWRKLGDNRYFIVSKGMTLVISKLDDTHYDFDCVEDERTYWYDYFDLSTSYRKIRGFITKNNDKFLYNACEYGKGIRILKQDPWETLISFIISQRKNIPAIKKCIEKLCMAAGYKAQDWHGIEYYTFPSPQQILKLSHEQLVACGLGYREEYVVDAAKMVSGALLNFHYLENIDRNACIAHLKKLNGVGDKVANCVTLFGLHHLNAFPIDVWIQRIIDEQYSGNYPINQYSPYNGIYQQYMYMYYRALHNRKQQ